MRQIPSQTGEKILLIFSFVVPASLLALKLLNPLAPSVHWKFMQLSAEGFA